MGSGKKQTIGYKYYLGLHLILCMGPIDRLLGMFADKKQAWTGEIDDGSFLVNAENLFGGEEKEGGISGTFDCEMGQDDQTQNGYLAVKLSPEIVPAYRGVVGIIARQAYVGTQTYLKNLAFLAQRIMRRQNGIEQWYPEKAAIISNPEEVATAVDMVVAGRTGSMKASPDGASWPYSPTTAPNYPVTEILLTQDKKSFYGITGFSRVVGSTDGMNWSVVANLSGIAPGGLKSFVFWQGYYWVVRSANGIARSLDCINWTTYGGGDIGNIYILYPAGERLLAESSSTSKMMYLDGPDNTWQLGGEKPIFNSFHDGVWANGLLKLATERGTTTRYAEVYSTPDGSGFTLDSSAYTNYDNGGYWAIAYGNGRWVAVGYDGRIGVKLDAGVWETRTDVFPYSTQRTDIQFFDNKFWILRNDNSGGPSTTGKIFYSVDASNGSWTETVSGITDVWSFSGGATIGEGIKNGDMNPAHIIRECLTDPDWGLGYQDSDIDDTAFELAADALYAEKFGMSLLWNRQTTIEDFIREIVKHIDASLFIDRKTGKFKLVLIRDDYDESTLLVLDKSNIERITDFSRPTFGELVNSITVQFWDRELMDDSSVTVQDIALAQMQGSTINTTRIYSGITNKELAARLAQRDLKTVSTPGATCTIYANREAADLEVGKPFKLTWPDYKCDELVMRVASIAYGNGSNNKIRITCTQDVYKLPNAAIIVPEVPAWTDPNTAPVAATLRLPFEVPYLEAVQQQGQTAVDALIAADPSAGYAGAAAGRPSQASTNAGMYTNSGAGYSNKDTLDFCPTAKLVANLNRLATSFEIKEGTDLDLVNPGEWLQIDDEMMSVVALVGTTLTVKRGVLDTIPTEHLLDSVLFFWDSLSGIDPTQYEDGESIDIKVTPITGQGQLALVDAPTDTLDIVGRLARPYPPANLTINGDYWPVALDDYSIALQWVDRNRLTQTGASLVGWYDAEITKEANVTYSLRVIRSSDNSVLYSADNIELSEYTVPFINEDLVRLELWSVRDGLESYQKVSYEFSIANALLTETEEVLLTESNIPIALEGTVFIQEPNVSVIYASGNNVYTSRPVIPSGEYFFKSTDGGATYTKLLNTGADKRITFANSGAEHYFAVLSDGSYASIAFNSLGDSANRYVIAKQVIGNLTTLPTSTPTVSGSDGTQDAYALGYPRTTANVYVRTVALGSDGTNFYLIGFYPDPSKPQGYRLFKAGATFVLTDLGAIAQDVSDPNTLAPTSPASWGSFFAANMQLEKFGSTWLLASTRAVYRITNIEDLNIWRWSNLGLNESTRTNPEMVLQRLIKANGVVLAFDGAINMAAVSKSSDDGATWTTIYPSAIRDGVLRYPVSYSNTGIIQGVGSTLAPQTGILATPFAAWTLHNTTGIPTGAHITQLTATSAGVVGSLDTGYIIYSANGYDFQFAQKD